MKQWISKMKTIICSNKGETLVEAIVSIILLMIFTLTISIVINTSLKITTSSTQNANSIQENINRIIQYDYSGDESVKITFSNEDFDISAKHNAKLNNDGIVAFTPEGADEP